MPYREFRFLNFFPLMVTMVEKNGIFQFFKPNFSSQNMDSFPSYIKGAVWIAICCVTSYTKASFISSVFRSSRPEVFILSVLLKISQNSQKNTCAWVSFLIKFQADTFNFIKKETLAQVFHCEFYQMHLVHRTHQVAAFEFFINTFQDN